MATTSKPAARPLGQRLQQQEFRYGQRNLLPFPADGMAQRIHAQRATVHDLGFFGNSHFTGRDRFLPAQQRADTLDQKPLGERLFHVIVCTHAQPQDLVDLVVLRGQEDDRHRGLLPQALQQIHAIHPRHLDVEHGHVGHAAVECVQRGLAVIVGFNFEAFGLKGHGDRRQDIPVVVHKGDPGHLQYSCFVELLRFTLIVRSLDNGRNREVRIASPSPWFGLRIWRRFD